MRETAWWRYFYDEHSQLKDGFIFSHQKDIFGFFFLHLLTLRICGDFLIREIYLFINRKHDEDVAGAVWSEDGLNANLVNNQIRYSAFFFLFGFITFSQ